MSTAAFLTDQKRLPKVEPRKAYEEFVAPQFIEAAVGHCGRVSRIRRWSRPQPLPSVPRGR